MTNKKGLVQISISDIFNIKYLTHTHTHTSEKCRCIVPGKFSRISLGGRKGGSKRGRWRGGEEGGRKRVHGAAAERDARAGASVVGGKREFALSHPRIYPTPSSQGAGLRYHPWPPGYPGPLFLVPLFFRRLAACSASRRCAVREPDSRGRFVFASCSTYTVLLPLPDSRFETVRA